jgi:hypothetical protein
VIPISMRTFLPGNQTIMTSRVSADSRDHSGMPAMAFAPQERSPEAWQRARLRRETCGRSLPVAC